MIKMARGQQIIKMTRTYYSLMIQIVHILAKSIINPLTPIMHKQPNPQSSIPIEPLCQQQEDEIQAILQSTPLSNSKYTDHEINHLINPCPKNNRPSLKNSLYSANSSYDDHSFQSRQNSLGSDNPKLPSRQSSQDQLSDRISDEFDLDQQDYFPNDGSPQTDISQIFLNQFNNRNPQSQILTPLQRFQNMKTRKNFPFSQIYRQMQQLQIPFTTEQVQKQYPSFLISKPSYKIQSTVRQKKTAFDFSEVKSPLNIIDISSPFKNKFYMAAGANSNKVIVHELYSSTPYQMVQVFKPGQKVKCLKWSGSSQYLIVSSQSNQAKLFQFRQLTQNEDCWDGMRWMKTPVEVWSLVYPKIKANIIDAYFIDENPVKVLLVDQEYEIYMVEMKKHFLSLKPHVTKLPIQFSPFLEMKLVKLSNEKQHFCTLMVVGGEDYVTLAIIEPAFEMLLVYDKEKHFPQAKRGGYPNILIVANEEQEISPKIVIVWDKHLEIIKLKIQNFEPLTYKIHTVLKYVFPDSSIMVGSLSSTLIYQLTRLQLKIYSLNELSKFNQNLSNNSEENSSQSERKQIKFAQPIYSKKVDFDEFSSGQRLQEILSNPVIHLQDLTVLKNLFTLSASTLFVCFEHCLYSVSIEPFPEYVETTIEAINDWKVGLQLINDGILMQITEFDSMNPKNLRKQLREYSSRYIEFLKGVIPDTASNSEIWKQQMCFLFNILIQSQEQKYLIKEILIKLYRVSPQLLKIYEPFIMMGLLTQIDVDTLDMLLSVVDQQAARRMVYSIRNSLAGTDQHNELAHLINNILIRYELYLELIWINQYFSDYYTPFVILVSKFEQTYAKKQPQVIELFEKAYEDEHKVRPDQQFLDGKISNFRLRKSQMAKLLSFLTFDTFKLINLSEYSRFFADEDHFHISKVKAKYLIETLMPIMHSKLNNILVQNSGQEFFDFVLEELFYGNSLNALSELSSGHNPRSMENLTTQIVENLPYKLVVEQKKQGKYWMFILRLMIRKIISRKVIPGLYYLTLEQPQQSSPLCQFIDLFVKECTQTVSQQLYSMEGEHKAEFFQKLKLSQYIELLKVVGAQLNREMEVLECMVACKKRHNAQIIDYMAHILNKAAQTSPEFHRETLSQLKSLLKRQIKLFTSFAPEQTSSFIISHFKSELKEFISYLEQTPKEQLNLLRQILTHYNYGQFLNNEKCKFLELLAINGQKDEILDQIKKHMFPLDEAIEICRKYEILDAWAFLLVKSGGTGNSTLAIEIYFRVISHHIDKYKYNRKTYERQLELQTLMLQQLHKAIQVCLELDISAYHQEQTEWFFIIEQLEALKKHVYKTCTPDVDSTVRQITFQILYPELIKSLLEEVPTGVILTYLQKAISNLDPETSQLIIEQMVKSCFHQKQILKNAEHQIAQCQINQRKQLLHQGLRGFLTKNRCYQCVKIDIHTKIHYRCGHDIHPECNQDVKECIACRHQEEAMLWRQVNLKDKVEKVIYYNPPDPNKDKSESEIIRLSRQEKLKNFDSLTENIPIGKL